LFLDVPAKGAKLDITVEVRGKAHAENIFDVFSAEGYQPARLSGGTALH
jgi:threonine dehydratase